VGACSIRWRQDRDYLVTAVLGVSGLALEARIAAGADTRAICTGDGRAFPIALFRAIATDCRGLVSFGVAGGLAFRSLCGNVRGGIND
jgi:hypothetical protein